MTALLPICSAKLRIVGLTQYYGREPRWNHEYCCFCFLKCQQIWLQNISLLHLIYLEFREEHRSSKLTSGRREEDTRTQVKYFSMRICMYFVKQRLQINHTVYHLYPPLAILTHKNLVIGALLELELEMTKIWFSFNAKAPRIQHMHHSPRRRWQGIYANKRQLFLIEVIFHQKN